MKRASAGRACELALLVLSLCLSVGAAHAQTTQTIFVRPGDTVSIPQPIQNAADSGDTINNVQVTVTGPSQVTSITPSATDSVAPGAVKTFTPTFVVDPNAQDGSFTVNLVTTIGDVGIDPDPSTQTTQLSFTRDRVPLLVEERGEDVFGSWAVFEPKLSPRLLYRQAGRLLELI